MSDTPAIELLSDSVEVNPLARWHESYSLASLHRTYSVSGLRPVRVIITRHAPGRPWAEQLDVLGPDMAWKYLLFNQALPAQDDNGEARADELAALAARLQMEAQR